MMAMGYRLSEKEEQELVDEKAKNLKKVKRLEERTQRLKQQKHDLEFRNTRIDNTISNSR